MNGIAGPLKITDAFSSSRDESRSAFTPLHPVLDLGIEGQVLVWDDRLGRSLGISNGKLEGTSFIDLVVPIDQTKFINALKEAVDDLEIVTIKIELLSVIKGKNPVELIMVPQVLRRADPIIKLMVIDLMPESELLSASERSKKALRDSENFISDLINLTTREIRQPLTTLLLNLELLDGGLYGEVNEKQKRKFEEMICSIDRMKDLLNDAIDTVKNIRKEQELNLESLGLLEILGSASEVWKEKIEEMSIDLQIMNEGNEDPLLYCDRGFIVQSISSILKASIDMSPLNGTISVSVDTSDGMAHLSISDMGDGIPQKERDTMFDRFGKHDPQERRPQALGLYMAKRMVDAHGGRLWCESYIGLGSTFIIKLPLKNKED